MRYSQASPPKKRGKMAADRPVQVIERMVSLLDALALARQGTTLKNLSGQTGLHPSTAYRILATLSDAHLVERTASGGYCLGMRLLELGDIVRQSRV